MLANHSQELRRLAEIYGWDMDPAQAPAREGRVLLRIMDVGVWNDMLNLERIVGHADLRRIVEGAPAGALSPRAWSFWHYRLGLTAPGDCVPTMPARRTR